MKERESMAKLSIGFTACYIHDYGAKSSVPLPAEVALLWAKETVGDFQTGFGSTFNELETPARWMNKLFVIVSATMDEWVAIYNHDGNFSIRMIPYTE